MLPIRSRYGLRVFVGAMLGFSAVQAADVAAPLPAPDQEQLKLDGAIRGGASSDANAIYAVSQRGEVAAIRST